jgi:hypothetical protein
MKKQYAVIIITVGVIVAIGVWVAAIFALTNNKSSEETMPNLGNDVNLMSAEEFGGMDVKITDLSFTGIEAAGLVDRLFGTDLVNILGGKR